MGGRSTRRDAAELTLPRQEVVTIDVAVPICITVTMRCAACRAEATLPIIEVIAIDVAVFVEVGFE